MKQIDPLKTLHRKECYTGERLGTHIPQFQNKLSPIVQIRFLIFDAFNVPEFIPYWEKHEGC